MDGPGSACQRELTAELEEHLPRLPLGAVDTFARVKRRAQVDNNLAMGQTAETSQLTRSSRPP
jgi:hypothetical protein